MAQFVLRILPPGFVVADGVDATGTHLGCNRGQHLRRISFTQDNLRVSVAETPAQAFQRVVQPHLRRAAIGVVACALVVQNINRDHRSGLGGGMEGGLIGHAQVAPEPDDLG